MRRKRSLLIVIVACLATVALVLARNVDLGPVNGTPPDVWKVVQAGPVYTAQEAADHIGERAAVCGEVAGATYAAAIRGAPTFLNLGRPHPNQPFTVVIWGADRPKFGRPEAYYLDLRICVAGRIRDHRGGPQIEVSEPWQLAVCQNGLC